MLNTCVLNNSMKLDARKGWHYGLKLVIGCLSLLFIYRTHFAAQTRMAGHLFFQLLGPVILTLYSVACYIIFSSLVVKERESGELDLLIIVGIDKVNYLVNRFVAAWLSFCGLLIVQIPLAMYAITFGGIHPAQITSIYLYLLVWLFFLSQLSFMYGVIFSRQNESFLVSLFLSSLVFIFLWQANMGGFQRIEGFLALGVTEVIYNDELLYLLGCGFLFFCSPLCFLCG